MKPKLKLGFADTHDHLATFFASALSQRYELEIDNQNPEFLLFGDENFGTSNKRFSRKDVVKIFYTGENRRPEKYDCDYAISFDHNFNTWHYRLPLFIVYMWALEHIHKTKYAYDYIFNPEVKEKSAFCSFVVSNPNCKERNDFFHKLSEYKTVDSGGRLFNNIKANLDGEAAKIDFLSTRKFNICFEPMSHPGYVTEKILHAFYAGTIPIYWGSPSVATDFNEKAFVNLHKFRNADEASEYVKYLDSNDGAYNAMLEQPKFTCNIPPSYMILDNFLNWFDAIVYKKSFKRKEETLIYF